MIFTAKVLIVKVLSPPLDWYDGFKAGTFKSYTEATQLYGGGVKI